MDSEPKIFGYKTPLGHRNNKTLRVGADQFIINLCRIAGTVDFIFDNADVVLQYCKQAHEWTE
ncbi:hypothetical protein SADUNF_Sadunf04G0012000 [Salix dunnii]|uniref:Pectinesterase catalytic domain-containing protein n=1 Tax=Salix dunnii TaxID=1413687 RepID=A0A835MYD0_9ROSI|nr:hypothetical protein SADUNF_Sadunf04G0012000 [Salix dunnii]